MSPRRSLSRTALRTVGEHRLIEAGDRILVAVSGGKDSYALVDLLAGARRKAPVEYEIVAFHLDQGQPGHDPEPLREWLRGRGLEHRIWREATYERVLEGAARSGSAYCSWCSRLRRGILYTQAERLGCNKVALGHHRDDALETLLMNLFWSGRLQAMPARYTTRDGRFEVIRPLVECPESSLVELARQEAYPILPCNLCGAQSDRRRDRAARLLSTLEEEIPNVRSVMLAALKNVRPTHLLDREVAEAWSRAAGEFAPRR